jgi:hypothetical protein
MSIVIDLIRIGIIVSYYVLLIMAIDTLIVVLVCICIYKAPMMLGLILEVTAYALIPVLLIIIAELRIIVELYVVLLVAANATLRPVIPCIRILAIIVLSLVFSAIAAGALIPVTCAICGVFGRIFMRKTVAFKGTYVTVGIATAAVGVLKRFTNVAANITYSVIARFECMCYFTLIGTSVTFSVTAIGVKMICLILNVVTYRALFPVLIGIVG